ncbi:MAG: branched-chain amino acid ABC transporter permease [Chloroflexi bacterium]|nr:branched-chain amino acid ABC transporter permease [Chloroflexota bacterium]
MPQELADFVQQLFNALMISGVYALVALGITVIFGLTGIVKFSIGELLTLGAFLAFAFWDNNITYFLAVPLAALAVGAVALVMERAAFRFTLDQPINGFIISLGLILVLQNLIVEFWGTEARTILPPFDGVWEVAGVRMPVQSWFVVWVTVGIIGTLFAGLRFTRYGRAMRACAEDREAAALMGIPVDRVIAGTFVLGGVLAALAGALLASIFAIHPYIGAQFLLKGFAVALVGGLGNVEGAVVAAIMVGLIETMGAGYLAPEWRDGYTFSLMILILLLRPRGLFPARGRLQETLQ